MRQQSKVVYVWSWDCDMAISAAERGWTAETLQELEQDKKVYKNIRRGGNKTFKITVEPLEEP